MTIARGRGGSSTGLVARAAASRVSSPVPMAVVSPDPSIDQHRSLSGESRQRPSKGSNPPEPPRRRIIYDAFAHTFVRRGARRATAGARKASEAPWKGGDRLPPREVAHRS